MNAVPRTAPLGTVVPDDVPTFDVRDLIQDGIQARLVLDGQTYTLRITRAGKLILTK
ncbi:hemin uptake protein HemP [Puniceibacterium confluentis]|uniref:hemin uptake protein HemP n=1 Tax=Puniceibacterium confluentis TaxID=1958944 RepID=UPI0011B67AE3|nr:hemin uptake protein HemP [Puniceibacterium confluentis]